MVKTVFVDTVKNVTVPIVVPTNGNLRAKKRVELFSEVQGVFRSGSKLFRTGQEYGAGQTLIRIDANEYYASVQSAKSNLYNLQISSSSIRWLAGDFFLIHDGSLTLLIVCILRLLAVQVHKAVNLAK